MDMVLESVKKIKSGNCTPPHYSQSKTGVHGLSIGGLAWDVWGMPTHTGGAAKHHNRCLTAGGR